MWFLELDYFIELRVFLSKVLNSSQKSKSSDQILKNSHSFGCSLQDALVNFFTTAPGLSLYIEIKLRLSSIDLSKTISRTHFTRLRIFRFIFSSWTEGYHTA